MGLSKLISLMMLTALPLFWGTSSLAEDYSKRADVQEFAVELAKSEGFEVSELLAIFEEAEYKQGIIDAISRPAEKTLMWDEYQDIFLTANRSVLGRIFMMQYRQAFHRAHETYGVPPAVIAAVIGVETRYGAIMGRYRVLDALTTLAFDYPPRADFFLGELREFMILVREEDQDILELKGSYAGAMGYGQFISSSYRNFAVDFDGDGVRDIWSNPVDAIGSVANYLSQHGWQKDQPIAIRVDAGEVDAGLFDSGLFNVSLEPSSTLGDFQRLGVKVTGLPETEISPMKLVGKDGDEFWLGFYNFYVITRYNHSKLYAMAVYQLSLTL